MKDKKIIVLMGGPSQEAEVSRRTGTAIAKALVKKGYKAEPLELNPRTLIQDIESRGGDIVFNAVHGLYGEDGALQGMLEMAGIPYTGSGIMASAIGMNKKASKEVFIGANIPTARAIAFNALKESKEEILTSIKENFAMPVVVKAATQGSSFGVVIVKEEQELAEALETVLSFGPMLVAEDYLDKDEFTVSVLDGKALPVILIRPNSGVYDFQSKYTKGATEYLVPAPISEKQTLALQEAAEAAYNALNCCGLARVDFMSDSEDNIYALEVNTIPGMTETSLSPKAAKAVGLDFASLCEEILKSAALKKF